MITETERSARFEDSSAGPLPDYRTLSPRVDVCHLWNLYFPLFQVPLINACETVPNVLYGLGFVVSQILKQVDPR
jgi:hypothetical protein